MTLSDRRPSPAKWVSSGTHDFSSPVTSITTLQPQRYPHQNAYPSPPELGSVPLKNEKELTRDALIQILDFFSQLVAQQFARPIRLVVHGGACMLLHEGLHKLSRQQQQISPSLPSRTTTRDVDYIHRSFVGEMTAAGMPDAAARLAECIKGAARKFGLGLDWMNSDPDISLPYAYDPSGKPYDPIYMASIQQNNIDLHTVYNAPNKYLTLISVTPFWAVSLKFSRYVKWDPGDICLLLRNGVVLSGTHWTPEQLENWLYTQCWAAGYAHYDSLKKQQLKERILHAINQLKIWNEAVGICDDRGPSSRKREREKEDRGMCTQPPPIPWGGRTVSAHDAMGGVDGEDSALSSGWTPATGQWPSRDQVLKSTPPRPTWNVVDWADGKFVPSGASGPGSDKDRKSDRDVSRSRANSRSGAPSRASGEVFIPDSSDDEWLHVNRPADRARSPQHGSGNTQQSWMYLNPNLAPNMKRPSSRQQVDPYNGIYGHPSKGKGLETMGTTFGGALDYGSPPNENRSHRIPSSGVIMSYHDYHDVDHARKAAARHAQAEKLRTKKKKERKRTKAIENARSNKWAPRDWPDGGADSSSGADDSEADSNDSSDDDGDGRIEADRRSRDSKTRISGDRNGHGHGHGHHDHLHDSTGWNAHKTYNIPHVSTPAAPSLHPPAHYQHPNSRPTSRNASPSKTKHRPPPLAISPPPVVIPTPRPHDMSTRPSKHPGQHSQPNEGSSVRVGAAERAQYQFEQQQKDYQRQLEKQSHQMNLNQVAQRVAQQVAAEQRHGSVGHIYPGNYPHYPPQGQQEHLHHSQRLKAAATWSQPHHQPAVVVGNGSQHHHIHQSWYPTQQQFQHPVQRSTQRI